MTAASTLVPVAELVKRNGVTFARESAAYRHARDALPLHFGKREWCRIDVRDYGQVIGEVP